MSKKTEQKTDTQPDVKVKEVKAIFKNTYIGDLGIFYRDREYTISGDLALKLKNDIEG
jgi:hypothetical protein